MSPSKLEKRSSLSLRKLKKKLSFRSKDRKDKNKLPHGIPTEIVFSTDDDYDDDFSSDSQSRGLPDLISAETPIKKRMPPVSESNTCEKKRQTNVWLESLSEQFQDLPDRFQSVQNALFANRKSLLAIATAAMVYSQVPETTRLQLSVFAAGLSSTIVEQSKALIVDNLPTTIEQTEHPENNDSSDEKMLEKKLAPGAILSRVISGVRNNNINEEPDIVSEEDENRPTEYNDDDLQDQQKSAIYDPIQEVVPAEIDYDIISPPSATLQDDDSGLVMENFHSGELQESTGSELVTSPQRESMSENDENVIVIQSNIMVHHDSANTIIVQNNIVVPEGSKGTIIIQSNIEVPEGSKTVNLDKLYEESTYRIENIPIVGQVVASMLGGTNDESEETETNENSDEMVNPLDMLEREEQDDIVPEATQPAADELPPECYNVFKKFLHKDCHAGDSDSNSTRERNWIESLLIDAWILNMDI